MNWLTGQLLVSMPTMQDQRFVRAVIYLCSHGPEGAMGLVVNRLYGEINFRGLLNQFNIMLSTATPDFPVHYGGPVEPARGFVLHSIDFRRESTMPVGEDVAVTANVEILQAMAEGIGPRHALLALGYAGWSAGQLEAEIQANGWLVVPSDNGIIFNPNIETIWEQSLAKIGVSPTMLSSDVGHA